MKQIILATILLVALTSAAWAAIIEVTQPVQATTNSYYERGQAVLYDGTDYWLFYGRSTTVTGNYDNDNPETHDYEVYYKKAATVPGLMLPGAAKVVGTNNANGYLGETGAAYFGSDVWAFATVDVGGSCDLYGWWTNDGGSSWNEVGPIITGLSAGQAHHSEIAFGDEIWIVEGSGNFTTTHTSTPKTSGWSTPLSVDDALGGGLVHFFIDGSDLYLAINASSINYIYKYNSGTTAWDKVDETTPPDKYDPTLFKVGSTYVFAQAPWASDTSPGGRQYLIAYSNTALDESFFDNGHKSVTTGKYGTNSWIDMWPIGFTDNGGTTYLFYSSERNPSDPTSEITGNIWYLEVDWDVTGDHYTYIQEAIDGAASNDIVDVAGGTYSESVVVNQALTLNGAKAGVDPCGGVWAGDITVVNPGTGGYGIDVQASNVTVSGFDITGGMYGIYIGSVDASNVTISYNDLHANDKYGLQAYGIGSTVSFVSVSTNYMHHNGRNGFKLVDATDCTVTSNEFAHNGFGAAATKPEYKYGIFLEDERYNAAQYSPAIRNSFTGNSFHDNALGAINMEVMGNAVSGYWSSTEFLEDTVVEGNDFGGGSSVWGINVSDDYNDDGSQDGFGPIAMVDATGNWWDDAGGPYHATTNTGGLGCKISDDVDYSPWWGGNYVGDPHSAAWQWHVDTSNSSTIQEGIDDASAGDIINVKDGIYNATTSNSTEWPGHPGEWWFVTINKSLNLVGESRDGVIIDGTALQAENRCTGIWVSSSNVTVKNLTLQNFTQTPLTAACYGLYVMEKFRDYVWGNVAALDNVTAENIRATGNCYPFYFMKTEHATVKDCISENNLSDGIWVAWGSNYATVHGNTVTNSSDHGIWVGASWMGPPGSNNATITGNTIDGAREGGISFVNSDGATIEGNVITNVAGDGWSVGALSLKDGPSNVTARYNVIYGNDGTWGGHSGTGHGIGIDGTPSNIDLKWNSVYANAGDGCHNYSTVDVDATRCWWGDATGPGGVGPGSGDEITAHVLFDPWIGKAGGENIVCVPDPEYLNVAGPTKTISMDYLGGGGGLMFGYSIKFSWDGSIASTSPAKVIQGSLLSDMGTTYFFVNPSGTNELTVDCALSGDYPGVTGPGTLFTIEFTGLSVGTSPIDITVIKIRDKVNTPLAGFFEDDGQLIVDVEAPVVTDVLIENLTLAHTNDYVKDTDAARVTATVTDDDPVFDAGNITANLTGLGGGAAVNPDTYDGGVATWTTALTSVACTPANGTVTVTVTATDDLGNTDSDSGDITSDNIAPAVISNISAVQAKSGNDGDGTTKITLTFTVPGDAYETEVYNAGYGDYPEYDDGTGAEPAVPAYPPVAPWAVTAVTATGQTDEPAARDFWYYVVFTKDIAYNISAVSNKTTGTLNYHLGDVSDGSTPGQGDNYVNSLDFSLMGTSYWKSDGDGGYLNYCDVGPTVDLSTDELPSTDDVIDFEDLMMFAINFTTVTLMCGDDPEVMPAIERPALRIEWDEQGEDRTDVVVAHLMLDGNSMAVKGLHSEIAFDVDGLELVAVTGGELLAGQGSPVFAEHHSADGVVQFDAAVLGRKLTIRGSGEVAELKFRLIGTAERLPVLKAGDLRDRKNRAIRWNVEPGVVDEPVPDSSTPGALSLGSHPNPFSGSTQIRLSLPSDSRVSLRVYDVSGRLVSTLADEVMTAGEHNVEWNGRSADGGQVAAGVYVVRMDVEGRKVTRKLFVLP